MEKEFSEKSFYFISKNSEAKQQILLYIDFVNKNMSLQEYFNKQNKIDKNQLKNAVEIKWKDLLNSNPAIYAHEHKHYEIFKKYGINAKLFLKNGCLFVMDLNFSTIYIEKKFNKKNVIDILSEMLIAPYKFCSNNKMGEYLFDIPCYETLIGNIKQLNREQFNFALNKYETTNQST